MNGLSCHLPGRQGTRDPLKKQDCLQLRPAPNPCSPCSPCSPCRVPFLQCWAKPGLGCVPSWGQCGWRGVVSS